VARAQPQQRPELVMNAKPNIDELFERRIIYPDFAPRERLAAADWARRPRSCGSPKSWRCYRFLG
jgi:hypothetical protein